jgi:hypothetical protein
MTEVNCSGEASGILSGLVVLWSSPASVDNPVCNDEVNENIGAFHPSGDLIAYFLSIC